MTTTIIDPGAVRRHLADPALRVPEADAASARPIERFRAASSRFVNGDAHDVRRARLEQRLADLDPAELAETAARMTRAASTASTAPTAPTAASTAATLSDLTISRRIPVACLARHLGFNRPERLPQLVATIAAAYPTGIAAVEGDGVIAADAADAAVDVALQAAVDGDAALDLQLLVQSCLATASLIDGALAAVAAAPAVSTRTALVQTLARRPPVPATRRVDPHGAVLVLPLGDPAAHPAADDPASMLAFGSGPRACPAPAHALAIAAAVVDVLRAHGHPLAATDASSASRTAGSGGDR
ncbi:hypothetical protein [Agromyces salentinus]|uniref:Cytochrome P450 n=1 Tax=Agromyces salentinus TaxID=269421 RepID=A0ABN2MRE1_9MICO|nr:hypothetical protein [Agromyces salentinus]